MPEILTGCSYGPISHHSGEIFFIHVGGVEIHFWSKHVGLQRLDPPPDARPRRRRDRTSRLSFCHMCGWPLVRLAARPTTGHGVGRRGMRTRCVGRTLILAAHRRRKKLCAQRRSCHHRVNHGLRAGMTPWQRSPRGAREQRAGRAHHGFALSTPADWQGFRLGLYFLELRLIGESS